MNMYSNDVNYHGTKWKVTGGEGEMCTHVAWNLGNQDIARFTVLKYWPHLAHPTRHGIAEIQLQPIGKHIGDI